MNLWSAPAERQRRRRFGGRTRIEPVHAAPGVDVRRRKSGVALALPAAVHKVSLRGLGSGIPHRAFPGGTDPDWDAR
ncbi:MAG TPA: hypothetical protein PLX89_27100 [Verrucomicrobiota bacterium]|nr:hypothetical protein [Verrucomicrobiales bacterium]HRI16677.1 hypothetical protein [Verrucomicrobiota bacterium]